MHHLAAEMINENSILRRLPQGLPLRQRLAIEGVAFALLSIETLHLRISGRIKPDLAEVSRNLSLIHRVEAILDCWAMVDQAFNLFKLLKSEKDTLASKEQIARIDKHEESVSAMRNVMDHLYQRTGNLSKIERPANNYLGDFVYITRDTGVSANGVPSIGYAYVQVTVGVMTYGSSTSGTRRLDLEPNEVVGDYFFEAFEATFDASGFIKDLYAFIDDYEKVIAGRIAAGAATYALEHGDDFKALLTPSADVAYSVARAFRGEEGVEVQIAQAQKRADLNLETIEIFEETWRKMSSRPSK